MTAGSRMLRIEVTDVRSVRVAVAVKAIIPTDAGTY